MTPKKKTTRRLVLAAGSTLGLFSIPMVLVLVIVLGFVVMIASAGSAEPSTATGNGGSDCTTTRAAIPIPATTAAAQASTTSMTVDTTTADTVMTATDMATTAPLPAAPAAAQCPTPCGPGGTTPGAAPPGVGLTSAVPEPMRSEIIAAATAAGVPAGAIAALYLTEQNGFKFEYDYYDAGMSDAAFQITAEDPAWKLSTYGTNGLWPPTTSKFRGAFQFGPVWESTYQTPEHPDVYKFADAAHGAAHYMADLGASTGAVEDIRAAAASYNGQISWTIGAGSIRNPDPTKFTVVRDLYADQVVRLTAALSAGTSTPDAMPSTSSATPTTETATGAAVTTSAAPAPLGCAGGTVAVNGPNITIPVHPNIETALQGKRIQAPTDQLAQALAWGFTQVGTPYVWGGGGLGSSNPGAADNGCNRGGGKKNSCGETIGFDCSGLAWTVLYNAGIKIADGNSGDQAAGGQHIPLAQALPGDLITYGGDSVDATHHVAVSLGWIDGKLAVLEAPDVGIPVRIKFTTSSDINSWASRYWTAT